MNPMQIALTPPSQPPVHPRLRTAFNVLGYCESVAIGRRRRGGEPGGRDLIAGEIAARNAALELIRHYLSGEIELEPALSPAPPWPMVAAEGPEGRHPDGDAGVTQHRPAAEPGDSHRGPSPDGPAPTDPSEPPAA